jgi:hypothetical protein
LKRENGNDKESRKDQIIGPDIITTVNRDETLVQDWERQKITREIEYIEDLISKKESYIKLAIVGISLAVYIYYIYFFPKSEFDVMQVYFLIFLIFLIIYAVYTNVQKQKAKVIQLKRFLSYLGKGKEQEITTAELFKPTALETVDIKETTEYFRDLLKINLRNLSDYYELVKIHTNKSFDAARFSSIIGFILIALALIFGFLMPENKISYISAGSGIIVEFIAGVFFYLYNRTVRELKGYHDSLLEVQNVIISFKLIDDIEDQEAKTKIIDNMIDCLVSKQSKKISEGRNREDSN